MDRIQRAYLNTLYMNDAHATYWWAFAIAICLVGFAIAGSAVVPFAVFFNALAFLQYLLGPHDRTLNIQEKTAIVLIAIYLGVTFFTSIIASNPNEGAAVSLSNAGLIGLAPLMFAVRRSASNDWQRNVTLKLAWLSLLFVPALVVETLFGASGRPELLAGNSLILSQLSGLVGVLLLCGAIWLPELNLRERVLVYCGAACSVFTVIIAAGRAAIAAIMLVFVLNLIFAAYRNKKRFSLVNAVKAVVLVTLITFALVFAIWQSKAGYRFAVFFQGVGLFEQTDITPDRGTDYRILMWKAGLKAAAEAPLKGYGRQNVMKVSKNFAEDTPDNDLIFSRTHLHNAWLTQLVASGILGLLAFSLLAFFPGWLALGKPISMVMAGISANLFLLVLQFLNIGFYHDLTVFSFLFLCALIHAQPPQERGDP